MTLNGVLFIFLTVIIAAVAALKGLNLLYLIVSMMLSFAVISQILSVMGIYRLNIERVLPVHIFAEKAFPVEIRIINRKKRFPSYSIMVQDISKGATLPWRYIVRIPPGDMQSIAYERRLERRGLYKFEGTRASTRFPLGFFQRGFTLWDVEEFIVYPRIDRLNPHFRADLMTEIESHLNRPGVGTEVYGFRKYAIGDDSRTINWKLTAKTSNVIVTKFSHDQNLYMVIVFDNSAYEDEKNLSGKEKHNDKNNAPEDFEAAVRFVASISSFFIEKGYKVKLITIGEKIDFGEGTQHLFLILEKLALIQTMPLEKSDWDIYHPGELGGHLGILVTRRKVNRPSGHFIHIFYAGENLKNKASTP